MKKLLKPLLFTAMFFSLMLLAQVTFADPPLPPPPPGGHGLGGNQQGAPIDGGLGILMALGIGYGAKKLYKARKTEEKAEEPTI